MAVGEWLIVGAIGSALLPTVTLVGLWATLNRDKAEQRDRLTRIETKVDLLWKDRWNGGGGA